MKRLIPYAEKVRFTSSGTGASHVRLTRAFTGKLKMVRSVATSVTGTIGSWAARPHYEGGGPMGVLPSIVELSILSVNKGYAAIASRGGARRQASASAMCRRRTLSLASRSASVRATRNTR